MLNTVSGSCLWKVVFLFCKSAPVSGEGFFSSYYMMSSPMGARIGRDRQRYDEEGRRLVSGCIPYRMMAKDVKGLCSSLEKGLEILMISSPNRDDLVFPKGGWDDDETVEEAAYREAWEEAGVKGNLGDKLGVWLFKSKSKQHLCGLEGGCEGHIFPMEVTEELDTWPEQENHDRKWLSIEDSFKLCRYEWMREALEKFMKVMKEKENHVMNKIPTMAFPVSDKDQGGAAVHNNTCPQLPAQMEIRFYVPMHSNAMLIL